MRIVSPACWQEGAEAAMWFIVVTLRRCQRAGLTTLRAVFGGPRTASHPRDDEPHRPFGCSLPRTTKNRPHRSGSPQVGISVTFNLIHFPLSPPGRGESDADYSIFINAPPSHYNSAPDPLTDAAPSSGSTQFPVAHPSSARPAPAVRAIHRA